MSYYKDLLNDFDIHSKIRKGVTKTNTICRHCKNIVEAYQVIKSFEGKIVNQLCPYCGKEIKFGDIHTFSNGEQLKGRATNSQEKKDKSEWNLNYDRI